MVTRLPFYFSYFCHFSTMKSPNSSKIFNFHLCFLFTQLFYDFFGTLFTFCSHRFITYSPTGISSMAYNLTWEPNLYIRFVQNQIYLLMELIVAF